MNKEQQFSRERHWQTQALVDTFATLKENEVVPYADLAERCKIDEKSVRARVQSAKKIVLREHHVIIDIVRGVGVARLTQTDVTAPVGRAIGRMRSAARTGHRLIRDGVTNFDKLSRETKSTVYMQQAIVGTVLLATDRTSRRLLKKHAEETNSEIKIGRTLEMLK
jgi:hypothetical protein